MSDTLAEEIRRLPQLDRTQLRVMWRSRLKQEPPAHLRKQLLVPLLAYKLQEQAYGGLRAETRRRLRELAPGFAGPQQARQKRELRSQIKPGTRFLRRWQGKTHSVTVSDKGFEYQGQRFENLSQIARQITGTRWSGPLFFGLRKKR